ncbi:MAG TPA: HEPN domain-containing protein [Chloroflexota bacterium]|nr:HEPN domain-containing protein [Chloroflexota bacterium]
MSEAERPREVRRWLLYAEQDLALGASPDAAPRQARNLAQQAAEKALKAVLVFLQVEFPFSHDLDALRDLVPDGWQLKKDHPDLSELTVWAVEPRYPGDLPEAAEDDARDGLRQARAVVESVLRDLDGHGFDVGQLR